MKRIVIALLIVAGCVEQQERQPSSTGVSDYDGDKARQEHEEQCGIDHDECVDECETHKESTQYHCIYSVCLERLQDCRGDG